VKGVLQELKAARECGKELDSCPLCLEPPEVRLKAAYIYIHCCVVDSD